MKKISIAVDGPSAAGKSSIAKIVAKRLDYIYIDTGAMYRCVGYYCLENNIDLKDEQAVSQALKQIKIEMDSNNHIFLNGQDVSQVIRQDQVSMSASVVSSYQAVRTFLVEQQRQMANVGGVILDGRDIGTVGRYLENLEKGIACNLEEIEQDLIRRDNIDSSRAFAPLRPAEDSILLDTSNMSINEVVNAVISIIEKKLGEME
ncbi:MAG: (d)CMP kinase [Thomasclavelia ramosa]